MNNTTDACKVLLGICSGCQKEEHILFVTDPDNYPIAREMWENAMEYPNKTIVMMEKRTVHGEEPTKLVALAMAQADVIFGITTFSLFHSEARRNAVVAGARFVNMVDYSLDMLKQGGLFADFIKQGDAAKRVAIKIIGDEIRITTALGTNIRAEISGRNAVPQFGRSISKGVSSSPPDIECAISPREGTAEGVVYIDGSIPHPELGMIREPIRITIKKGNIDEISGGNQAKILKQILESFHDLNAYNLGEIGIGLNPLCNLNGRMLEDEGAYGTVHFGFGNNISFGGVVNSACHIDMVFRDPTVIVDKHNVLVNGEIDY